MVSILTAQDRCSYGCQGRFSSNPKFYILHPIAGVGEGAAPSILCSACGRITFFPGATASSKSMEITSAGIVRLFSSACDGRGQVFQGPPKYGEPGMKATTGGGGGGAPSPLRWIQA